MLQAVHCAVGTSPVIRLFCGSEEENGQNGNERVQGQYNENRWRADVNIRGVPQESLEQADAFLRDSVDRFFDPDSVELASRYPRRDSDYRGDGVFGCRAGVLLRAGLGTGRDDVAVYRAGAVCSASQLVGHQVFEKRRPAFTDNAIQLLIGPLYFVAEVLFLLGFKQDLQREIQRLEIIFRSRRISPSHT
jgi:hypothetical protein